MKKILVLTDFSANATCAAEAGLMLSGKLHTDLLLFNTYIDYATMSSYGGAGWIIDEFTERKKSSLRGLESLTEGLEYFSCELEPDNRKPVISFELNDCSLEMDVADILVKNEVELIVMGARSHDRDDALYGDDTNSIVNHVTRPVLIVPAKTDLKQIRKAVFATDFDEADFKAIHYLVKLGKLFHYQLEIIHVIKPDQKAAGQSAKALAFKEKLTKLKYQGLTYHEAGGEDVINRLNHLCTETGAGLLALLHHQRPFFARLFTHSKTKKALSELKVPLLVFPSKMN
ncbi:universal stress protein [Mucilaginibacter flavidus]|uniref:universal stress protein n=1 Tax=Mucilaginibacter flavidus TaxID=2949309 RepID=UPI0020933794|nr:universal stress protein [Mucilaginibacter flavidus]MCO5948174.1 universal stress protein [Mucilaginibacter flavidus]